MNKVNPWAYQPENAPKVEGILEATRKCLTKEDIKHFAAMLKPVPDTRVEHLAKLFKAYLTGEAHDKLVADGKMPSRVILNTQKIEDDEFLKLAFYSLNVYFNVSFSLASNSDADAVYFMFSQPFPERLEKSRHTIEISEDYPLPPYYGFQ